MAYFIYWGENAGHGNVTHAWASPCNLPGAVTARAGLNRWRTGSRSQTAEGGCGALLWLAICSPTSLSIWYVVVGRHHPRLWRNTLCVVLSQLSAVLTNFQSIILMPGGVNGFVSGRKTFPSWSFPLITRMCLFYFNFDRSQVMSHLWEGTVSGTSVPYSPPPPLFSFSNGENRATTW